MPARNPLMMQGHFERNLTHLGLVLAVRKVNGRTTFSRTLSDPGIFGRTELHCTATMGHVVPHGVDSDILAAITTLFVDLNMPADGTVVVSARQLLKQAGLDDGGENYKMLYTSLLRMQHANYSVINTWFDHKMHTRTSKVFNLLASVSTVDRDEDVENLKAIRAGTMLQLQLPKPIVESITSGFYRSFNMEFYRELKSVLARAIYRTLDEMRNPEEGPETHSVTISFPAWAGFLGYEDVNLSSIRANLEQSHTELIDKGFLKSVSYAGRGQKSAVTYVFDPALRPSPPADLVLMLTSRGVQKTRAQELATEYGRGRVVDAVARFEAAKARGSTFRNQAGALVDIMKKPENYPLPDEPPAALPPVAAARPQKEADLEAPQPSRSTARFILKKVDVPEALKLDVEDLHMEGLVTASEVASLKSDADPKRTITLWGARRVAGAAVSG